jgi:hypothetical protein
METITRVSLTLQYLATKTAKQQTLSMHVTSCALVRLDS